LTATDHQALSQLARPSILVESLEGRDPLHQLTPASGDTLPLFAALGEAVTTAFLDHPGS
jgi:hypothetical protein